MKAIKLIILFLYIIIGISSINAQNWLWSGHVTGTGDITAKKIASDTLNNIYVLGVFQNDITAPQAVTNYGLKDIFLAKYDMDGNFLWLRNAGSDQNDIPTALIVDDSGNAYITGGFKDTARFENDTIISINNEDIFLAKYSTNGSLIWVKNIARGLNADRAQSMTLDYAGDIVIAGDFKDSLIFDNDTLVAIGTVKNHFIAKFDSSGNFIWAKMFRGNSNTTKISSLANCNNQGFYISGYFQDSLFIGNDTLVPKGITDIFIFKVNNNGDVQWSKQAGNTQADRGNDLCSDLQGNAYLTGYFKDTVLFDTISVISAGAEDIFIAKYDSLGNAKWVYTNGSTSIDIAYGICTRDDLLYITGRFTGTTIWNNDTLNSSGLDLFIAVADTSGNIIKAKSAQGNLEDRGQSIVVDNNSDPYISGYFLSDTLFLYNDTLINAGVTKDLFLAKYGCPDITLAFNVTEPLCFGLCNGSATVIPAGGAEPYSYLWSDAQTNNPATGLCAGTYCVTVTDANGCIGADCVTITQPPLLTASITDTTHLICNGVCIGSATVTPVDGTPPYSYIWNDSFAQTDSTAISLCAGAYDVTVTDANLCTTTASVTITEPPLLTASITDITHISCFGLCDGQAIVTPVGGTQPYSYLWSDGQSDSTAISLCADTFYVTVTDNNSCTAVSSVIITQPAPLIIDTIIITNELACYGDCDAAVDITVSGGTMPYVYLWSTGATPEDISNLCDGVYCVTVTDFNLCTATACVTITEPPLLTSSITDTIHLLCNSVCIGSATDTPVGGTPPYAYEWNTVPAQTDSIATGLCAEIYCVTATDANLCTVTACVTITQPAELLLTLDSTDATCIICNDGSIDLIVAGGILPYTYLWSNGDTTEDPDSLLPGIYAVTVTDANLCDAIDSIEVSYLSSINEIADNGEINIYPNPTDGFLYITYPENETPEYIRIYNILGENIISIENPNNSGFNKIDMSAYAEGTYIVKILLDNKEVFRTVVLSTGR